MSLAEGTSVIPVSSVGEARGKLALTQIDKNFPGSDVPALRGVSITTEPGEFVVVVGPSGCGKSTLLNVAAGMIKPDRGKVLP